MSFKSAGGSASSRCIIFFFPKMRPKITVCVHLLPLYHKLIFCWCFMLSQANWAKDNPAQETNAKLLWIEGHWLMNHCGIQNILCSTQMLPSVLSLSSQDV